MFNGKTYLITGASSGIGKATALLLAEAGARIVAVSRNSDRLAELEACLPGNGHQTVAADAADEATVKTLIEMGREVGGFNGALLAAGAHAMAPLVLGSNAGFEDMYRSNVLTATNGMKAMSKTASKSGAGIVLLASTAAIQGSAGFGAYAAAKSALLGLCKTAAVELAPRKIRVNALVVGVVDTPLSEKWMAQISDAQRQHIAERHLLGIGTPEAVAKAAAFLMSDDANWITGAQLAVDGGLSVR